jgi:hypothetical protein
MLDLISYDQKHHTETEAQERHFEWSDLSLECDISTRNAAALAIISYRIVDSDALNDERCRTQHSLGCEEYERVGRPCGWQSGLERESFASRALPCAIR